MNLKGARAPIVKTKPTHLGPFPYMSVTINYSAKGALGSAPAGDVSKAPESPTVILLALRMHETCTSGTWLKGAGFACI